MDPIQEMRDEIADLKTELATVESHDAHDHGGAPGRDDAAAEKLRATITSREAALEARIRELESADGFKGPKNLDAEAFGTAP